MISLKIYIVKEPVLIAQEKLVILMVIVPTNLIIVKIMLQKEKNVIFLALTKMNIVQHAKEMGPV
jgi:hypothetical protein